jgi:hypothetical protein
MPPAEARQEVVEPTLPARKLPEVGLQSLAEMLPGSGIATGIQKGGTEGGTDFLAEILGVIGGIAGSPAGPKGTVLGYTIGKGASKGLRKLLDDQNNMIPVSEVKKPIAKKDETKLEEKSSVKDLSSLLNNSDDLDNYQTAWKAENKVTKGQKQLDSVSDAAIKLDEGKITSKEFRNIVKRDLPIKPIKNMVEVRCFR